MGIAIVVIAYNRLDSLRRLLSSLDSAYYDQDTVPLIISIDKSDTNSIEEYANSYQWDFGEKKVLTYTENLGLRKHVLKCGELLDTYDALIVLEDDIIVAPSFYLYSKDTVTFYEKDNNIAGISLYNFPINYQNSLPFMPLQGEDDVYFMNCAQSWGQVWMRAQWHAFKEWYERNKEEIEETDRLPKAICKWPKSSWLKYHTKYCIEQNKYFVYPYVALSSNNSDAGTHVKKEGATTLYQTKLLWGKKSTFRLKALGSSLLHYDGFFEAKFISHYLNMSSTDLCVDFYGMKGNAEKKRYWLTRKSLNYKVLKSYALSLKPYELNIIYNIEGDGLFLYDTSEALVKRVNKNSAINWTEYLYAVNPHQYIRTLTLRGLFYYAIGKVKNKLVK